LPLGSAASASPFFVAAAHALFCGRERVLYGAEASVALYRSALRCKTHALLRRTETAMGFAETYVGWVARYKLAIIIFWLALTAAAGIFGFNFMKVLFFLLLLLLSLPSSPVDRLFPVVLCVLVSRPRPLQTSHRREARQRSLVTCSHATSPSKPSFRTQSC
jgi:hypothetical protein